MEQWALCASICAVSSRRKSWISSDRDQSSELQMVFGGDSPTVGVTRRLRSQPGNQGEPDSGRRAIWNVVKVQELSSPPKE